MRKPWSITTTVRNPLRIKDFLKVAAELCGRLWNRDTQKEYQKLLIQKRLYGFDSVQFYNGLPAEITSLIDDTDAEIPMEAIDEILRIKNYADFDMRGRQSMNPLTKFGFIRITYPYVTLFSNKFQLCVRFYHNQVNKDKLI